jgi:hypothetical protein
MNPDYKMLTAEERRAVLVRYAEMLDLHVLVESGTSTGDTPYYLRDNFNKIYTIECVNDIYNEAMQRLSPYSNIHTFWGDSAEVLPQILKELDEPALFWLDGHWSAPGHNPEGRDTPVEIELQLILAEEMLPHVILIDDARVFMEGADWETERYDYPTLSWVRQYAWAHDYTYALRDDIIRLTPYYENWKCCK